MTSAHIRIALAGLLAVDLLMVACHKAAAQKRSPDVGRLAQDTLRVAFKDTVVSTFGPPDARNFDLRRPGQRDSLRALLKKERALWRAKRARDYRFLLRVGCFCPGQKGWLLIEARSGQPVRAWDRTGKPAALTDWSTFSIDRLYENLQRSADRDGEVLIAFDPRWHFPSYARTVALPGPDMWSIIEARGFRPK
jgi:hypothetical protein